MSRKQVYPDQRLGRLVVIRETDKRNGKRYALCRCDCGTVREFDIYNLLSGRAKSCGCLSRENLKRGRQTVALDLAGKTFGRLTVIRSEDVRKGGSIVWTCACTCGNVVSVPARDLVSGNTTSCGCAAVDHARSLKEYNERYIVDGVFVPLLRQKTQHNNKTGVKGVSIQRDKKGRVRYVANITFKGKRYYLGIYPTIEKAAEARRKAEEKFFSPYTDTSPIPRNTTDICDQKH